MREAMLFVVIFGMLSAVFAIGGCTAALLYFCLVVLGCAIYWWG